MARNPVLSELTKLKPQMVRLHLGNGSDPKELHVTERRNRWSLLWRSIEAFPDWVRAEACTKDGKVLGVVNNPQADELALESLDGAVEDDLSRAVGAQTRTMAAFAERMVNSQARHNEKLIELVMNVLQVISDRMVELERMQWDNMQRAANEAVGENAARMSDVLVAQMAPQLAAKLFGNDKRQRTVKPNGAK